MPQAVSGAGPGPVRQTAAAPTSASTPAPAPGPPFAATMAEQVPGVSQPQLTVLTAAATNHSYPRSVIQSAAPSPYGLRSYQLNFPSKDDPTAAREAPVNKHESLFDIYGAYEHSGEQAASPDGSKSGENNPDNGPGNDAENKPETSFCQSSSTQFDPALLDHRLDSLTSASPPLSPTHPPSHDNSILSIGSLPNFSALGPDEPADMLNSFFDPQLEAAQKQRKPGRASQPATPLRTRQPVDSVLQSPAGSRRVHRFQSMPDMAPERAHAGQTQSYGPPLSHLSQNAHPHPIPEGAPVRLEENMQHPPPPHFPTTGRVPSVGSVGVASTGSIRVSSVGSVGPPPRPSFARQYSGTASSTAASTTTAATTSSSCSTDIPELIELQKRRSAVCAHPGDPLHGLALIKALLAAASACGKGSDPFRRDSLASEAAGLLKRLVAAAFPPAMFFQAESQRTGNELLGLGPNSREAFALYQSGAKHGHGPSALRTAEACQSGDGTRQDTYKAVQWFKRAAVLGEPDAMHKLGAGLLHGTLGQSDEGEGINWLNRAAERDHPSAIYELAVAYESPPGRCKLIPDEGHARELFNRAATLGHPAAQHRLGLAYQQGELGLPTNDKLSIVWFTRAAAQSYPAAALALSGWYLIGAPGLLEQNDTEAFLWARKAAQAPNPDPTALFAVGYYRERGIGCAADIVEAKGWYKAAAHAGDERAHRRLEELLQQRVSRSDLRPQESFLRKPVKPAKPMKPVEGGAFEKQQQQQPQQQPQPQPQLQPQPQQQQSQQQPQKQKQKQQQPVQQQRKQLVSRRQSAVLSKDGRDRRGKEKKECVVM